MAQGHWTDRPDRLVITAAGGPQATASAINNFGQVARQAETSTNATDGLLYSNGKMTDLGGNFFPAAINNKGQIVANAYDTATYPTHALLLNPS